MSSNLNSICYLVHRIFYYLISYPMYYIIEFFDNLRIVKIFNLCVTHELSVLRFRCSK